MDGIQSKQSWVRVSKSFKCGICGKDNWCTWSPTLRGFCCMRVDSKQPMRNGGYFHRDLSEARPLPKPDPEKPKIDAAALMRDWAESTPDHWIRQHASQLKVSPLSLMSLGIVWARPHHAWGFPMFNGNGLMVGIRLRTAAGRKWSVTGGHDGVFLCTEPPQYTAYIVEGPTDSAAAITLGLFPIGRPNCRSAIAHTQVTINRLRIKRCVVLRDNDVPGLDPKRPYEQPGCDGAIALARELQVPVGSMVLPTKDLRKFLEWGGTRAIIEMKESKLVWQPPR